MTNSKIPDHIRQPSHKRINPHHATTDNWNALHFLFIHYFCYINLSHRVPPLANMRAYDPFIHDDLLYPTSSLSQVSEVIPSSRSLYFSILWDGVLGNSFTNEALYNKEPQNQPFETGRRWSRLFRDKNTPPSRKMMTANTSSSERSWMGCQPMPSQKLSGEY